MHMAEQVVGAMLHVIPLPEREVAHDNLLPFNTDFLVVLTGGEVPVELRSSQLLIMVTIDQVNFTCQVL